MSVHNNRRRNALKHEGFSATTIIPGEDAAEFEKLHQALVSAFSSIAESERAAEAKARKELRDLYSLVEMGEDATVPYLLSNLAIYERLDASCMAASNPWEIANGMIPDKPYLNRL